jgi:hypothetical protein
VQKRAGVPAGIIGRVSSWSELITAYFEAEYLQIGSEPELSWRLTDAHGYPPAGSLVSPAMLVAS